MTGVLALTIGGYIYSTNQTTTTDKTKDGEKVIASIKGDANVTEKDFAKELKRSTSDLQFALWRNAVVDEAVELTKEDQETVKEYIKNMKTNMKAQYGDDYNLKVKKQLAQSGYTEYRDYIKGLVKTKRIQYNYVIKHLDDYKTEFENLKPRKFKYIIVENTEDAKKEAEKTKVKDSKNVVEGYLDTRAKEDSELPAELLDAILSKNEGEETDWFTDSETKYAYKAYIYDLGYDKNKDNLDLYENAVIEKGNWANILYEASKGVKISYPDEKFKENVESVLKSGGVTIEEESKK